ncbi:MAG: DUF6761 family protein [Prochloraceae cyanobacterium]
MDRTDLTKGNNPIHSRRAQLNIMLTDSLTIRYYQKLTDAMVDLWQRGRRYDEIQMYMEGYIASLRQTNALEAYKTHRLEEEAFRFLRDPSNFELAMPQTQMETQTDYY